MILGMDWMSKYGGSIDCVSKSICLTTPEGKRIKYVSRHAPRRTQVNSLSGVVQEEVPVVKDYPDVFPKELPHATGSGHRVFNQIVTRHRTNIQETVPDARK